MEVYEEGEMVCSNFEPCSVLCGWCKLFGSVRCYWKCSKRYKIRMLYKIKIKKLILILLVNRIDESKFYNFIKSKTPQPE